MPYTYLQDIKPLYTFETTISFNRSCTCIYKLYIQLHTYVYNFKSIYNFLIHFCVGFRPYVNTVFRSMEMVLPVKVNYSPRHHPCQNQQCVP